jgi:AraC-like DNA-binding protein
MEELLSRIEGMMDYLISLGYFVSMHFKADAIKSLNYKAWQRLLPYNSHNNPFCLAVKCESAEKCVSYQTGLIDSLGTDMRIATCYAGVRECVFPIRPSEVTIGYLALGAFTSSDGGISDNNAAKDALLEDEVPERMCSALLPALAGLIEELFRGCSSSEENEENMISQYLQENHTNITFDELCRHFARSRSYMSHAFKRIFGASFSEYTNRLRLADAEKMLVNSEIPITDIALNAGFGDVSYFIKLFKSHYGEPPLRYRNKRKK